MNQAGLLLVFCLSFAALITAQDDRQCLDNPTGTLHFDVRGVPGPEGPRGKRGHRGYQGITGERGLDGDVGPMGTKGMTGQTGAKGEPGDTIINKEELDRVRQMVDEAINASIIERLASLRCNCCNKTETTEGSEANKTTEATETTKAPNNNSRTLCNILSNDWTRIAYLDTTQGQTCPPALRTFTNTTTNQKACGTQVTGFKNFPAVSLTFPTNKSYTHVCGRVRGYVYKYAQAFYVAFRDINSNYVDGVSITMGSPRQHLWTYAIGVSETYERIDYACPCARSGYVASSIPAFVGDHLYCESAYVGQYQSRIAWEDALWDGKNCITEGNTCCDRFGWFHREVASTQDSIEVRWIKYHKSYWTEVMTDQLEIWVM